MKLVWTYALSLFLFAIGSTIIPMGLVTAFSSGGTESGWFTPIALTSNAVALLSIGLLLGRRHPLASWKVAGGFLALFFPVCLAVSRTGEIGVAETSAVFLVLAALVVLGVGLSKLGRQASEG